MTKASDGNWSAKCPAHDDNTASLSLKIAKDDGRLLCVCHAGCSFNEIVDALGVQPKDFFKQEVKPMSQSQIEKTYDYTDENGQLVYQAVRKRPKTFRQRQPDGKGGWDWNLSGVRRVLYKLPELLAADQGRAVFVVEGEKDVETLMSQGYIATCNPGGAGKWRDDYSETLKGRNVVLIPDNDATGLKHVYEAAVSLHKSCSSVKIIQLPNLQEKGDVTDWFEGGGSKGEFEMIVKASARYDGTNPSFTLASQMASDAPVTPPASSTESVAVSDTGAASEARRVVRGVEQIMRRSSMIESDPSGFVYMAMGIMEALKSGKEVDCK